MELTRIQRLKLWAKNHPDEIVTGSIIALYGAATVALVVVYRSASKDISAMTPDFGGPLPYDIRKEMINGVERAVHILADKNGAELWTFIVPAE